MQELHLQEEQEVFEVFECPLCFKKYNKFYSLKMHIAKSHKSNNTKCPICGKKCKSLLMHLKNRSKVCERHKILYGLFSNRSRERTDFKEEATYLAYESTKKMKKRC